MKITIVYAATRAESAESARRLHSFLEERGVEHSVMSLTDFEKADTSAGDDILIVLGGDGTMLRAARRITSPSIVVAGVNYGRAGYLCQIQPAELYESMEKILERDYQVDRVSRLAVYLDDRFLGDVLNEILISSRRPGRIIEYRIAQEDLILVDVADGVIISTPIGSTAYALSAGGPAVHEDVEAMVVAPLASMTNLRPLVVPMSTPLYVNVSKGEPQILVDGHTYYDVGQSTVKVVKSPNSLGFIRLRGQLMFSRRLRKRLYQHRPFET
ncbi:MAG: NAD(+)/NADH kinase [Nitrososphaerota archaeon]